MDGTSARPPAWRGWWGDAVALGCLAAAAAGLIGLAVSVRVPAPDRPAGTALVAFFFAVLAVLQVIPVRVFHADEREEVSLREAFIVPMVLLLAPGVTVALIGLTTVIGQVSRRASPVKTIFNVGQTMAAATLAVVAGWVLRGGAPVSSGRAVAAAAAAGLVYASTCSVAVAAIIAASSRATFGATILEGAGLRVATWIGALSFGVMIAAASGDDRWVLLVAVAPVVALQVGFSSALAQRRERRQVEELYRAAAEVRSGIDHQEILARLCEAAIPLLDARQARCLVTGEAPAPDTESWPAAGTLGERLLTRVSEQVVLEVARGRHDREWNDADRRLASTIAEVAASALDRARLFEDVKHQALYDALTGLPNQVLFEDRVRQALAARARDASGLAVAYLDLDNFKRINDSLGHAAGDELLKAASRRLESVMRAGDTVARMSGDEFVCLLLSVDHPDVAAAAGQRMVDAFATPFDLGGLKVYCTASAGIALCPGHAETYGGLLQKSDLALYQAKARGRGTSSVYAPTMGEITKRRLGLEADLRRALDNDELHVLYQAQVDVGTRSIVGAEALVRWRHPTLGELTPDQFIPLAEELGLVRLIDQWVLGEVCAQVGRWREAGLPTIGVAVNVSGAELGRPDVADHILATIGSSAIDPSLIEVELTESLAMQEGFDARLILQALRDRGITIAIDDFGTGHSSLARLGSFPVDVVKIDKSFIDPVGSGEAPLVPAIIAMAHSLQLVVVAEGVERAEQLRFLQDHGCDRVQGYLLGRPVPPAQFAAALGAGRIVLRPIADPAGPTPLAPARSTTKG